MIKITDIRKTKLERFALFSHEEFLLSVDAETIVKMDIHQGCTLSAQEYDVLKGMSDTRKAKDQALRFLARRPYGEMELYEKLCRKHDEYSAAAAVASMAEMQLLDDGQFAKERAEALARKGKSKRAIIQALQEQGIQAQLAMETVHDLELDETDLAIQILRKSYTDKLNAGKKQAVMAALARRGFCYSNIKEALETVLEEQEME